jgi:hypothetical protein
MKRKENLIPASIMILMALMIYVIPNQFWQGFVFITGAISFMSYGIFAPVEPLKTPPDLPATAITHFKNTYHRHVKPIWGQDFVFKVTLVGQHEKQRGLSVLLIILMVIAFLTYEFWSETAGLILTLCYATIVSSIVILRSYIRMQQWIMLWRVAREMDSSVELVVYYAKVYIYARKRAAPLL